LGLFADHQQCAYVERLLGQRSAAALRNSLAGSVFVRGLIEEFEAWPTLRDEDIEQSWSREAEYRRWRNPDSRTLERRLAVKHASDRSMRLAMNNLHLAPPPGHDIPDVDLPKLDHLMREW
jgi:hypothetical protein